VTPLASPIGSVPAAAAQVASAPGAADECEHVFSPPAGAKLLCDERVYATGAEINWRSYATRESRVEVNRRYQTLAARCRVGVVSKPPVFSISQGLTHLSTHEPSGNDYPTCTTRAAPSHRTVIVISTMLKR
jgi:hypothetical protein